MAIDPLFRSRSLINSLDNEQYARLSIVSFIGVFPVISTLFPGVSWFQPGDFAHETSILILLEFSLFCHKNFTPEMTVIEVKPTEHAVNFGRICLSGWSDCYGVSYSPGGNYRPDSRHCLYASIHSAPAGLCSPHSRAVTPTL